MYQDWRIRAFIYLLIGVALFGYSNTMAPGLLLLLAAALYLFVRWRGETEPVLDDPWASISDLADDNDNEEEEEEDDLEIEIAPKKTRKMRNR